MGADSHPWDSGNEMPVGNVGRLITNVRLMHQAGVTGLFADHNGFNSRSGWCELQAWLVYRLARDELFAPLAPQPPQVPLVTAVHIDYPEANLERLVAVIERELQALVRHVPAADNVVRYAVRLARAHPGREVVFIGVGFETTAPAAAAGRPAPVRRSSSRGISRATRVPAPRRASR